MCPTPTVPIIPFDGDNRKKEKKLGALRAHTILRCYHRSIPRDNTD